eukprot:c23479_g1_i1.p1 GENE.c23479_g1_i1~~c23479_g1_i1.p1  ORF type:complete len:462 (-),score=109.33 c23479_g1_i1:455-1840(-)
MGQTTTPNDMHTNNEVAASIPKRCPVKGLDPSTIPREYRHENCIFVLAGDIGGTNSRFALYDIAAGPHATGNDGLGGTTIFRKQYLNSGFTSFAEVVLQFLSEAKLEVRPSAACFAVAGPVASNVVVLTNISQWVIDGYALQGTLQIPCVRIINDFSGIGYGLLTLEDSETVTLQQGEHRPGAPILCIGAGTGLGECFLARGLGEHDQYEVFASEGGHVDFAPHGELQTELADFIAKKHNAARGRISVERVVSGQGIADTYDFLRTKFAAEADKATSDAFDAANKDNKPAIVNTSAASGTCPVAQRAVAIFLEAYGSEVGNCALKYLPAGGIYIAGGLMPRFLDRLEKSDFFTAFRNKGRMSKLVHTIPLKVVTDEDIGLRGAKVCAARELIEARKKVESRNIPSPIPQQPSPSINMSASDSVVFQLRKSDLTLLALVAIAGAALTFLRSSPSSRLSTNGR